MPQNDCFSLKKNFQMMAEFLSLEIVLENEIELREQKKRQLDFSKNFIFKSMLKQIYTQIETFP